MTEDRLPVTPQFIPPLDPDFHPASLFNRAYRGEMERTGQSLSLVVGVERPDGTCSRYETRVFNAQHSWSAYNNFYVERILKFLLWQRGGFQSLSWRSVRDWCASPQPLFTHGCAQIRF